MISSVSASVIPSHAQERGDSSTDKKGKEKRIM